MLDLAIPADADLVTSTKIALGSMMSTARADRSVGPPCDAGVYRTGTFALDEYRFTAESARSRRSSASSETCAEQAILDALGRLPRVSLTELRAADEARTG